MSTGGSRDRFTNWEGGGGIHELLFFFFFVDLLVIVFLSNFGEKESAHFSFFLLSRQFISYGGPQLTQREATAPDRDIAADIFTSLLPTL